MLNNLKSQTKTEAIQKCYNLISSKDARITTSYQEKHRRIRERRKKEYSNKSISISDTERRRGISKRGYDIKKETPPPPSFLFGIITEKESAPFLEKKRKYFPAELHFLSYKGRSSMWCACRAADWEIWNSPRLKGKIRQHFYQQHFFFV